MSTMAFPSRALYRNLCTPLLKPVKWDFNKCNQLKISTYCVSTFCPVLSSAPQLYSNHGTSFSVPNRTFCTQPDSNKQLAEEKKLSLFKRFKQMARDYWYVLIPVHCATSIVWFGGFYYALRSGVDVLGALESMGISERFMEPIRNSGAGYLALSFACYKVVTPLRYAVTLGSTTFAIKKLTSLGLIKPMPSKERIKEVFQEQKENIQEKIIESTQHYQAQVKEKQIQIKEKKTHIMEEMTRFKADMRNIKDRVKKM